MQGGGRVHKFHAPHRVRSTERRHDAGATPSFGCLLCSGLRRCVCYARQGRIPPSMHPCIHVRTRVQESTRTTIRRVSVLRPQRMPVVRRHACGVHVFVFFPLPCDAVVGRRIRWVGCTFMTPNFLFFESPSEIQGTSGPSLSNALPVQTIPGVETRTDVFVSSSSSSDNIAEERSMHDADGCGFQCSCVHWWFQKRKNLILRSWRKRRCRIQTKGR